MFDSEFEKQIYARLRQAEIQVQPGRKTKGFQADFTVFAPDGRVALIEAKSWLWFGGNIARAGDLANAIRERTDANAVFFVLNELDKNWPSKNVYKLDGIVDGVKNWIREQVGDKVVRPGTGRLKFEGKAPGRTKKLFAAMPFDRKYDDTFVFAMTKAAEAIDAVAIRVDQEYFTQQIIDQVKSDIVHCSVVVADVSNSNPNVLYELGYARGKSKQCIQICSSPLSSLPFDVKGYPTISYELGSVSKLAPKLVHSVRNLTK